MKKTFILLFITNVLVLLLLVMGCTQGGGSSGGGSGGSGGDDGDDEANPGFIKTVDSAGDVGRFTSIAVDSANIYISYSDTTNSDLKFVRSTDGGAIWLAGNIKTVDSADNVGFHSSIAVYGTNIYISYFDNTNGDLKFAKSTDSGVTWLAGNIKTIDSVGSVGYNTSIAVDGSNIYISYYDITNSDLKFAKSTDGGTTWLAGNIKTVDSGGDVGGSSSIAINGTNIYISYNDSTNTNLKFAKSIDSGDTWLAGNIKTVDSAGNVGYNTSIAIDGSNIYISYVDSNNADLKFARSTDSGDTWLAGNIKTVDSGGDVGFETSIAVNGTNIYISYYDSTNADLKFTKSTDSGVAWLAGNIKTVDYDGDVGNYTSIAVNGSNIYISYFNNTNGDLKIAKSTDSGATW